MAKSHPNSSAAGFGRWRYLPVEALPRHIYRNIAAFGQKHPRLSLLAKFISVYLVFWILAWRRNYDPDFGWHLQAGRYIAENGIPATDLYTYTMPYFHWINHEWLSDVLLAKLYALGGYELLTFLYAGLWATALLIAGAYKRWAVVFLAALAMAPYSGVRATTWTVFFLAIFIALVRSRRPKAWDYIPPLFLVWANMHGGFFIGLAVLGFYYVVERDHKWLWALLLSALATFINPYGPRLYDEVFRTLNDSQVHWQITEWFPAAFLFYRTSFIFTAIWLSGYIITRAKWSLKSLLNVNLIFMLASFSSNRHFPLFVLVAASDVPGFYEHLRKLIPKKLDAPRKLILAVVPTIVVVICGLYVYGITYGIGRHPPRYQGYPTAAAEYLRQHPCPGNIFASYNYGGYLIWNLPGVPVYIDGRGPIWRDDQGRRLFDRYDKLVFDKDAAQSEDFKTYNIRCIIWPKTEKGPPMIDSIKDAKWQKIDAGSQDSYVLYRASDNSRH